MSECIFTNLLILHDLSDEECLTVLKKCREAIASNGQGKVIIIDIVINEEKDEHEITEAKLLFDLLMMVVVTGRERSEKDWKKLFLEAGFSSYKLGIPDIIDRHGQPITLPDLVTALQIHPAKTGNVHRLMRLMVHSGFFARKEVPKNHGEADKGEEEAYDLTPSSRLLLKDKVPSLSPFVLGMLDPAIAAPWQFLGNWFRGTEVTPFESAHGMGFWEYGEGNPEFNSLFNKAMASDSGMMNLVIRDCKPIFDGLSSLVDVGGGTGKVARILCDAFPQLKCTVLELPHVVADLPDGENLKFVGGDMFQGIPPADAVFLKLTLHALSDEDCLKVLKKCREAIASNGQGKVIIIDIVINEEKDEHEITEAKLLFDLLMMVVVTGRERSEKDWKKLFLEAGFSSYKVTPIFGLRSLLEVFL